MYDGWKISIWRDKLLLFLAEVGSACPMIPSSWMWNSRHWVSFRIQVPSALDKTSETCWHSKEGFCPKFRQVPVDSLAVERESDGKFVMWIHTYLTKLAQHVLPGDAHILQQEVAIVNVLKIHFGTNVSCSYACRRRKQPAYFHLNFLLPILYQDGDFKRRAWSALLFPQHGWSCSRGETGIECLGVVCFHDPLKMDLCWLGSELRCWCRGAQSSSGYAKGLVWIWLRIC